MGHHVALSVVGTERLQDSGYFRAKLAQERLIKASGIPYTIVRATQFFEFVGGIAQSATVGQTVRLSPALVQPISSDDVAAALADITVGAPVNGTVEVAGPEPFRSMNSSEDICVRPRIPARWSRTSTQRYFGVELNDQSLTAWRRRTHRARRASRTGSAIQRVRTRAMAQAHGLCSSDLRLAELARRQITSREG